MPVRNTGRETVGTVTKARIIADMMMAKYV